jgi:hypothetical protein
MVMNGGDQVTHNENIACGNRVFRGPLEAPLISLADFRSQHNRKGSIDDVLIRIKLTIKKIVCKTSLLRGLYERGEPISHAGKKRESPKDSMYEVQTHHNLA